MIQVTDDRSVIEEQSGIPTPNPHPYDGIVAGMAVWNEAHRLGALLDVLQPWFRRIVIVVQESTDDTLAIAQARARSGDEVVREEHMGTGDASMPTLLSRIRAPWSFVIAGDETPDEEMLGGLWHAAWYADSVFASAVWLPFTSIVEGVPYSEQHGYVRLFRTLLGWPGTMHSRPTAERELWWPFGKIVHDRSLDELIQDYLRIMEIGRGKPMWEDHNRLMMHDACEGVARVKGWDFVKAFPWWPQVRTIAFPQEP